MRESELAVFGERFCLSARLPPCVCVDKRKLLLRLLKEALLRGRPTRLRSEPIEIGRRGSFGTTNFLQAPRRFVTVDSVLTSALELKTCGGVGIFSGVALNPDSRVGVGDDMRDMTKRQEVSVQSVQNASVEY